MAQNEAFDVAANVRAEMARAGYSARKMAEKLGTMTARTLSRRLTGDGSFRVDELTAISAALGIPLSALMPLELSA